MNVLCSEILPPNTILVSKDVFLALKDPEAYRAQEQAKLDELSRAVDYIQQLTKSRPEPFDPSNL